jgi:hypothetical protein
VSEEEDGTSQLQSELLFADQILSFEIGRHGSSEIHIHWGTTWERTFRDPQMASTGKHNLGIHAVLVDCLFRWRFLLFLHKFKELCNLPSISIQAKDQPYMRMQNFKGRSRFLIQKVYVYIYMYI